MASIFTYDPDPPRVSSPWSTSGSSTPQVAVSGNRNTAARTRSGTNLDTGDHDFLSDYGITKLEPEPQEGPTEYKLHLLLRPRRLYTSISTGNLVGGLYHSRISLSTSGPLTSPVEETSVKLPQTRSTESRQQRLQQLTTQLLWRLQQSSPFHSSTTANLVLPVLPEATPKLGFTKKPPRLLPGLEESQGALYEIGVADDGTFVGLIQEELDESLTNLQAMAASLGCKVEVLRRVIVGNCEWTEEPGADELSSGKVRAESLWVAEALVSPDWDYYRVQSPKAGLCENNVSNRTKNSFPEGYFSSTDQIRVSITGPNAVGKSSLLGTLTSSVLDNGRGTSRLGLLKHRHEISSGVTSCVAHELIGYTTEGSSTDGVDIVNYSAGNVAAWDDVHAASEGGRLAFVSDLPGSVRYCKSTLRGLVSWAPHYVFMCIPATCEEDVSPGPGRDPSEPPTDLNLALSYLKLCIKLEIPTIVVITKMDLASRAGLRTNLTKVLSALKVSGKKPVMLSVESGSSEKGMDLQHIRSTDAAEVKKIISATDDWTAAVPIVLTSAVDGSGIGKLHAFLRYLPVPSRPSLRTISLPRSLPRTQRPANFFDVDEVFAIPPSKVYSEQEQPNQGVVLCGLVRYGSISVGDELVIGPVIASSQSDNGNGQAAQKPRFDRRSDYASHCGSYRSRPPSGDYSNYFPSSPGKASLSSQAYWQRVRVVSVRNLRLPVQKLQEDQVGTIGIEPVGACPDEQPSRLGKVRKGAVLVSPLEPTSSVPRPLSLIVGFVASFHSSEFASSLSPPVLLGGNAIAYIANVRTTVKLTCMALAEDEVISSPPSPTEPEFFRFDADTPNCDASQNSEVNEMVRSSGNAMRGTIDITFSFVTSVEWIEVGSKVLLMPGTSAALASTEGSSSLTGLEGFVGRVCDVRYAEGSESTR